MTGSPAFRMFSHLSIASPTRVEAEAAEVMLEVRSEVTLVVSSLPPLLRTSTASLLSSSGLLARGVTQPDIQSKDQEQTTKSSREEAEEPKEEEEDADVVSGKSWWRSSSMVGVVSPQ